MGVWGTAIFSDDTACDVREDFRDLIGDGLSPEQATDQLVAGYASSIDDPQDGPPFWLGLAVAQWKCGRLQERVKARALEIIDSGADLQRWSPDAKLVKARQAVLTKTRALLVSPQPAARRISKRFRESNDWQVGELISYRMPSGKHVVFRVLDHSVDKGGKRPVMDLLDYYDDTAPTFEVARELRPRRTLSKHEFGYHIDPPFWVGAASAREIPVERLTRLGSYGSVQWRKTGTRVLLWRQIDAYLEKKMTQGITWRPGPGGADHERWETGDVLAHETASGTYLLFHVVGRYEGDGIDGAPVVAHLDWQERSLPSAEAIRSGALLPDRDRIFAYRGFVFVHGDDDAVDPSTLRRIGNFRPVYDRFLDSFRDGATPIFRAERQTADDLGLRPHASLPAALRRIERKRARPRPG